MNNKEQKPMKYKTNNVKINKTKNFFGVTTKLLKPAYHN